MSDTAEGTCGECPHLASAGAYDTLLELHRYLFPERYDEDAPLYEWHAGTIDDVARRLERALPDAPRPRPQHESAQERRDRLLREHAPPAPDPGKPARGAGQS